jgi:LuxR family maltose regulon positive regulatory protein
VSIVDCATPAGGLRHRASNGPLVVARPRLIERTREGIRNRLTCVTAPAGYGKSVLVQQSLAEHNEFLVLSVNVPSCAPKEWVGAVVGDIHESGEWLLVIDAPELSADVHAVDAVRTLIATAPRNVHLLVMCRSRWPAGFDLADLSPGPVVLDEADLAFTFDEARVLVEGVSGRTLTTQQTEALLARTEGWVVGLRAGAIGLRHATDVDEFIEGFSGDDRNVRDFLCEEVLSREPAEVRRFLVGTSVLDQMKPGLVEAVEGEPARGHLLQDLAGRGVFTRATTDGCFAYHSLFRSVLRHELRVMFPAVEPDLLMRAAAWYEDAGDPGSAARYLIEAERWDLLTELVDRQALRMFERGTADQGLRWLDAVPTHRHHGLATRRAFLHTMVGEVRRAEHCVHHVQVRGPSVGEQAVLDALRAAWAFIDASPRRAIAAADAALIAVDQLSAEEIPDLFGMTTPTRLREMAVGGRAIARWYTGADALARADLLALGQRRGMYPPWRAQVFGSLALLEAWAGNFCAGSWYARRAAMIAGEHGLRDHSATLGATLARAHIFRERGELRRADGSINEAQAVATRWRQSVFLTICAIERALWHLASGHPERGLAEIDRCRASGESVPPPKIESRRRAVEVQALLAMGAVEHAQSILDEEAGPLPPDLLGAQVQCAIARHDLDAAAAHVNDWAGARLEPRSQLERGLWIAVTHFEAGNRRDALQRASAVVDEARREGHVRLFLDAGRSVTRLLAALHRAAPSPHVRNLLEVGEATLGEGFGAIDLSERELEIIRFLPTSLASREIAAQLYISVNTLKTHLRSIYRKLGVEGRREAILEAQLLGLA